MLLLRFLIAVFTAVLFYTSSFGQCSQSLAQAERTYEAGRLEEIASIMGNCFDIENGFSKSEKQRAYRLLTLTYLYTDQIEEAEQSLISLLSEEPEYEINSADPAEFVELLGKFRTTPIFSLGITAGGNITFVQLQNAFGVHNTEVSQGNYKTLPGYQVGLSADIPIYKFIEFTPEVMLTQQNFMYDNEMFGYTKMTSTEKQTSLMIPVSLKALLLEGKNRPYIEGGLMTNLLFSAEANFTRTFLKNFEALDERAPQDQTVPMLGGANSLRKKMNISYFVGVGIRRKIKRAYVSLGLRFGQTIENVVETKNRYTNRDLIFRYGYLDDDFLLRSLQLNFRYIYSFYKPKKLKRKNK